MAEEILTTCERCGKSSTYKKCDKCGNMFRIEYDYYGYQFPTNRLEKVDKFHGHNSKFSYHDICPVCQGELADWLSAWLVK